jgi:two-component system cell cycle response regulator CtrA
MREGVFAVRGQPIRLTKLELAVMAVLARSAGRTVGKDLLMMAQDAIAPVGRDVEVKIIDVYICKIRRKLLAAGTPLRIQTHWGHGWKLMLDENEHAPSVAPTTLDPHALPVQANMVPLPSGPH